MFPPLIPLILFLFILIQNMSGQEKSSSLQINFRGHYGFIMVHRDNMSHLVKGHPYMLEFSISKPTYGVKEWEQIYAFPEIGVSFLYADLANRQQLGTAYALYPYINYRMNRNDKCNMRLRIGAGIGYFPTTFDIFENHKNLAISSHLNGAISVLFANRLCLSKRISWENGISFTHFSNGAYKMPNLGVNIVTLNTGVSLSLGNTERKPVKTTALAQKKAFDFLIVGTAGIKSLEAAGQKYFVYTLRMVLDKAMNRKSSLGVGLDIGYNSSLFDKLIYDSIFVTNKAAIIQPGINLSYTLNMDKLSLFINNGFYLNKVDIRSGLFYHRLGIRYKFNYNLIANVSLKTHFGVADHFEFGIGYCFTK